MKTKWTYYLRMFSGGFVGWIGYFLGGLDGLLNALIVFVVLDYIAGVMYSIIIRKWSDDVGFKGIFKKILIFVMVGVGHIVDRVIIGNGEAIRTAVIFFYLSLEGISFLENANKIGLPVPQRLKDILTQLNERSAENMNMIINKKLCPQGLGNNPNKPLKAVNYITIHNTGNYDSTSTAQNHAIYQYNGSGGSQTSWHYTVDKDSIWQSFEDTQACWHSGNTEGNDTSIAIEICVNDKVGFQSACYNASRLTAELLNRYNLTIDKVVQHNKWSGKNCPAELRSGAWGIDWSGFISLVKQYLDSTSNTPIAKSTVMTAEYFDVIKAIDVLAENGVILSPEYWLNNYTKLRYVDLLLINMAKKLIEDHDES